ncbi:Dynein light chain 1, cytoplasmic [Cyberlindnera fabianii]|nr:Dynein light chain 1, cytoplasmic [Cyberlindnera fabianii]
MSTNDKPIVKAQDIAPELQQAVLDISAKALADHKIEKDIAAQIKKEMDSTYGHTWHVIVGKNFGSYVTHELGYFIYFYIGPYAFLVFKTS